MSRKNRFLATTLLAALPLIGACDSQSLQPPEAVDGIFVRYMSIGNSITAGFQSGGITEALQRQSYPVLLATQMGLTVDAEGAEFNAPLMNAPGCPPPYTNIFTQERVMDLPDEACYLRQATPEYLNNVAVPGAAVIDALTNLGAESNANALTTLFLGGRTQLEVAAGLQPTFVTVWTGNNDALGAITATADAGDDSYITEPATFASRYNSMMDSLDAIGTIEGGALIGVVQVGLAPYLTQGRAWAAFEVGFDAQVHQQLDAAFQDLTGGSSLPFTANIFDVNANCATGFQVIPGTSDTAWASIPFHLGGTVLSSASARAADPAVIDSIFSVALGDPAATLPVPDSLDCTSEAAVSVGEMVDLIVAVASYNATIQEAANDRGWVYLDPNELLGQLAADTSAIRPFPAFPGTAAESVTLNSPFGTALSLDGIHPSASSHVAVANALIAAINAEYGTNIPLVDQ